MPKKTKRPLSPEEARDEYLRVVASIRDGLLAASKSKRRKPPKIEVLFEAATEAVEAGADLLEEWLGEDIVEEREALVDGMARAYAVGHRFPATDVFDEDGRPWLTVHGLPSQGLSAAWIAAGMPGVDLAEIHRLKMSPEVTFFMLSHGMELPDCPPAIKAPEPGELV